MPSLVNKRSPATEGSRLYYWVNMIVPLGSEGSGIPVLIGFMLSPFIKMCELPLSKYLYFISLYNESWLNVVYVVVATPMLPVMGFFVVYF